MYKMIVAQRIADAIAFAGVYILHARAEKQMKAYKVTLPMRKAIGLDHFLHENGITLSALVESYVDYVAKDPDNDLIVGPLADRTIDARQIDARRRRRSDN